MVDFEQIYNECQCAGAAAGVNSISSFAPENNQGVIDIHEKSLEESTSKNNIRFREGVLEYIPENLKSNGEKMNFKKIYQMSFNESMEDDNWDEPYEGDEMDDISHLDFNVLDGEWDVHQDYEDSMASDMKPIGTPHNDEQVDYDGVYGYQDPNPENWLGFESEHMIPTKPLGHGRYQFESPTLAGVGEGRDYTGGYAEIVDYDPFEESFNQSYSSSKSMPRVRESRALIGGSLESKEKTDYENTLEEHSKKRKYDKIIDSIDQKLTGPDSGAHGKHEWTGELKK